MKQMLVATVAVVMLVGMLFSTGCATPQYQQNQNAWNKGLIGTGLGAGTALIIANNSHGAFNRGEAAAAGGAIGGLVGYLLGSQQDQVNAQMGAVNEMASTIVVNVVNSNGSTTPVVIRRVGNQYMGPRGEYYNSVPTADQLKSYGF